MPLESKKYRFEFNLITPCSIIIEAIDENFARDRFDDLLTQGELVASSKLSDIGFIDDSNITCHREY